MNVAMRAAPVLPLELHANWVFRITEDEATRAEELGTVVRTLILLGVVLPLIVLFPLEWMVLGSGTGKGSGNRARSRMTAGSPATRLQGARSGLSRGDFSRS